MFDGREGHLTAVRTRLVWLAAVALPVALAVGVLIGRLASPATDGTGTPSQAPVSGVTAGSVSLAKLPSIPALPTPKPKRRTPAPPAARTVTTGPGGGATAGGGTAAPVTSSGGSAGGTSAPKKSSGGSSSGGSSGGSGCSGEICALTGLN